MTNEILNDLKQENNKAFGELYRLYFNTVLTYVLNNGGNIDDAEDLFQDTMIVLVEKLRQDNFYLTASLKTYIVAISRNLWLKKLRSINRTDNIEILDNSELIEEINDTIEETKTYRDRLFIYLHKITAHCRGLIHDMFFKNKSIEEIQKQYGYTNRHNLQNQKHKCIEQIKKVKETEKKY